MDDGGLPSGKAPELSIIVPIYNEASSAAQVLEQVLGLPIDKEVIAVDDGSTDGTRELLAARFTGRPGLRLILQDRNQGKGAAVRAGFAAAAGRAVIVQDADLELDPRDILSVARPVLDGTTAACYGTRFAAGRRDSGRVSYWANRLLTGLTNALFGASLTDMETCYKCVRRDVLGSLRLEANRFEFEPEITAKLLRGGHAILEVPIRYRPRSRSQGKKIGWRDGLAAAAALLRLRLG